MEVYSLIHAESHLVRFVLSIKKPSEGVIYLLGQVLMPESRSRHPPLITSSLVMMLSHTISLALEHLWTLMYVHQQELKLEIVFVHILEFGSSLRGR
jgi:hypothetical protein